MSYNLYSSFASDLENLIELKKATGYSERTYLPRARAFDEFCAVNCPDADLVTETLAVQWIKHAYESRPSSVHERISFLRIFGKYQTSIGKPAFVIKEQYTSGKSIFLPYIMSDSEIEELFSAMNPMHF